MLVSLVIARVLVTMILDLTSPLQLAQEIAVVTEAIPMDQLHSQEVAAPATAATAAHQTQVLDLTWAMEIVTPLEGPPLEGPSKGRNDEVIVLFLS